MDDFGPWVDRAHLVAEWRELLSGEVRASSGVEQAQAEERSSELEVAMIGEFQLTLPPETEPLDESRRDEDLGWRRKALEQARQERIRRENLRLLRRILTLGLWWK